MVFHIRLPRRLSMLARRSSYPSHHHNHTSHGHRNEGYSHSLHVPPAQNNSGASSRSSSVPQLIKFTMSRAAAKQRKLLGSDIYREFLAEFLATFILCAIGNGGVLMNILGNGDNRPFVNSFCYGVGVMVGVSLSLNISGAHMNPAVTFALAVNGKFKWRKVIPYWCAQYWGAFLSSGILYELYWEAINEFEGGMFLTAGGFVTSPAKHVSIYGAFTDQVVGTAILLVCINAVTDDRALAPPKQMVPLYLSFVITGVCTGYGYNCGAIFNPARDFSPRLFLVVAGYGWKVFEDLDGYYWWVAAIIAPHLGAMLGMWIYSGFIGIHNNGFSEPVCIGKAAHQEDDQGQKKKFSRWPVLHNLLEHSVSLNQSQNNFLNVSSRQVSRESSFSIEMEDQSNSKSGNNSSSGPQQRDHDNSKEEKFLESNMSESRDPYKV